MDGTNFWYRPYLLIPTGDFKMNNYSNKDITKLKDRGQIGGIYTGYGLLIASLIRVKIEYLLIGSLFIVISALIIWKWKQASTSRLVEIKRLLKFLPFIIITQAFAFVVLFKYQTQTSFYLNLSVIGNMLNDAIVLFSLLKIKKYLEENIDASKN